MPSPRKLDAAMVERLAEAVGSGLPDRYAAQLCGLSPSTVKQWRSAGKTATPQSLLARLDRKLAKADSEFIRASPCEDREGEAGCVALLMRGCLNENSRIISLSSSVSRRERPATSRN